MKSDLFVSVAIILDKPLAENREVLQLIQSELDNNYADYEVVIVGNSKGLQLTQQDDEVLQQIPSLRYLHLASRVSPEIAWSAAIENVIGDFVVMFNPDEDPVTVISEVVATCKSGFDVVLGIADQPRTVGYKLSRPLADYILKLVDYSLPRNVTSLRCLSRRAVNSVTSSGRLHNQLSMRIQKTGFPYKDYNYTLLSSEGKRRLRSFGHGLRDMLRLLVFNSFRPLRWMSGLGIIGSLSAFLFAVYSLLVHIVKGDVVEGWTTTILFLSSLFMIQFVMMAFFGEYLGRLLDERGDKADYSVVVERNSAVMVNQDRVNVLSGSVSAEENLVQTGRNR